MTLPFCNQQRRLSAVSTFLTSLILFLVALQTKAVAPCLAFGVLYPLTCNRPHHRRPRTRSAGASNEVRLLLILSACNNHQDGDDDKDDSLWNKAYSRADEIQVEKARRKLEEENTRGFLKRRPLKLPYDDARIWIQANLGCDSRDEFEDLVANGNLRTPYIPKRPEEYYTRTREWISWEHFLTGCFDDEQPSNVGPQTGVFD